MNKIKHGFTKIKTKVISFLYTATNFLKKGKCSIGTVFRLQEQCTLEMIS